MLRTMKISFEQSQQLHHLHRQYDIYIYYNIHYRLTGKV